tara:strand:- start:356 stop:502 length:147 start_codon:yes stop_codon:yes gene_type:complete
MYNFIYLSIVMMLFLIAYVLVGHDLIVATLLFLIFLSNLGRINENQDK